LLRAEHADGTREYDAHNLYGTTMAMRSNPAATEVIGKRPFFLLRCLWPALVAWMLALVSRQLRVPTHAAITAPLRSTFPGAGKWAGHWTGDNGANWESLRDSVPSILAPNMWGIAMVGADICGFVDMADYNGNGRDMDPPKYRLSDDEYHQLCNRCVVAGCAVLCCAVCHVLCEAAWMMTQAEVDSVGCVPAWRRWTSAGAFYPFVRNHYTYDSRNHEPYR
jgi:alpha-glucosidase (family GH31 glycosyl hydrolase)